MTRTRHRISKILEILDTTKLRCFLVLAHAVAIAMSTADELKALGNKAIAAKDFDDAM